jgi:hypothetical protein
MRRLNHFKWIKSVLKIADKNIIMIFFYNIIILWKKGFYYIPKLEKSDKTGTGKYSLFTEDLAFAFISFDEP